MTLKDENRVALLMSLIIFLVRDLVLRVCTFRQLSICFVFRNLK